ncbi:hypothetical protein NQZ68_002117 [Dissostichus eleginoides]|nr:hypothetical protein NQZ68_002117 [Dissostichus eleginoides]
MLRASRRPLPCDFSQHLAQLCAPVLNIKGKPGRRPLLGSQNLGASSQQAPLRMKGCFVPGMMYAASVYKGGGRDWWASWQPLAPLCPMGFRLGENSLYCDSWDLGANLNRTHSETNTDKHIYTGGHKGWDGGQTKDGMKFQSIKGFSFIEALCHRPTEKTEYLVGSSFPGCGFGLQGDENEDMIFGKQEAGVMEVGDCRKPSREGG